MPKLLKFGYYNIAFGTTTWLILFLYKINSFMNQKENIKECQTLHTSTLNEIFFETLDEIDCFRDPFSILK
jgi:hypothetical protein